MNGYDQYINTQIYTAGYPDVNIYKGDKHFSSGELIKIRSDKKEIFLHNCDTREGSSGSPILNSDQKVIGIHIGCNNKKTTNVGIFIGFIIDKLNSIDDTINVTRSLFISDYSYNSSGSGIDNYV